MYDLQVTPPSTKPNSSTVMPSSAALRSYLPAHLCETEYYNKIDVCHKNGNSNEFIEFILLMLDEVLDSVILSSYKESRHISDQVNKLLSVMEPDIPYSSNELLSLLNVKSKETLRSSYLNPAIENVLIKMTLPEKPNSKNQKYIK